MFIVETRDPYDEQKVGEAGVVWILEARCEANVHGIEVII